MPKEIKEGAAAPAFSLPSSSGETVKLSDFKGDKNVVLYFYPKDDTPGCTIEACEFTEAKRKFSAKDTVILGVSPDGLTKHDKFIDKFNLKIELLADEEHKVAEKYGAWGEKMNYGKKYMGIIRSTFLIGKDGKIAKAWTKVKAKGHAAEVLEALKQI